MRSLLESSPEKFLETFDGFYGGNVVMYENGLNDKTDNATMRAHKARFLAGIKFTKT